MTAMNEPQEPQQPDTTTGEPPQPVPAPEPGSGDEDDEGNTTPGRETF
jgi:hypothetical protein